MAGERIFVVEDEPIVRLHLTAAVESLGYRVSGSFATAEEAIAHARAEPPDLALLDVRLAGQLDGIEAGAVLRRDLAVPLVYVTAHSDSDTLERARATSPAAYLVKPFTTQNVKAALAMALPVPPTRGPLHGDENGELGMVGRSAAMRELFAEIRAVAVVDWTVLVEGETGTGKELVARAIHDSGPRRSRPFVAVNCATLTESLAASQLFGHRRGAFTGAVSDQRGVFETADGGTLFLDEVGDVPIALQPALLRVIEDKRVTPLGSTVPRQVDVRVVAATNRDLAAASEVGGFRSDLLYRLRASRIRLPPLRRRREDLELLANHFLRRARAATGRRASTLSPAALDRVLRHRWPGNVRELQSAINHAVLRSAGEALEPCDFPAEVGSGARSPEDERALMRSALEATAGHRGRAAARLGISRATLYRRLAVLGLD